MRRCLIVASVGLVFALGVRMAVPGACGPEGRQLATRYHARQRTSSFYQQAVQRMVPRGNASKSKASEPAQPAKFTPSSSANPGVKKR